MNEGTGKGRENERNAAPDVPPSPLGTRRNERTVSWPWLAGTALALSLLGSLTPTARAGSPESAAATEDPDATRGALAQLRHGGNAVDAAVTAALIGGVSKPTSSGIGGGGFAMIWDAVERRARALDFREVAPAGIDVAAFEKRPFSNVDRGKWVGVPSEVQGLYELHRSRGKLSWSEVVLPAARLARSGYSVGAHVAKVSDSMATKLVGDPLLASWFLPGGKPVGEGATLRNPLLATTLDRIAAEGPSAFYAGSVAADIVAATRAANGALSLDDLANYRPLWREPLSVSWEGKAVFTMPAPSAGGLMLVQALKSFRAEELRQNPPTSGAYIHALAEVLRPAIADRMRYVGDPAFVPTNFEELTSTARLARRRRDATPTTTRPLAHFHQAEHGTHHLVTRDSDGNVVSLTTTVNRAFGAKLAAPQSGIILNDELDDFSTQASAAAFGLTESPNRPRPGARPVSSMTPTIVVEGGRAVLAIGGSGGMAIATNVTQCLLARLVFGLEPAQVLALDRFSLPTEDTTIDLGPGAPDSLLVDLRGRGETVQRRSWDSTGVQLLAMDGAHLSAAADPRKHGAAGVE